MGLSLTATSHIHMIISFIVDIRIMIIAALTTIKLNKTQLSHCDKCGPYTGSITFVKCPSCFSWFIWLFCFSLPAQFISVCVIYVLFYQSASLAKTSLINLMSLVYRQDFGLEDILWEQSEPCSWKLISQILTVHMMAWLTTSQNPLAFPITF